MGRKQQLLKEKRMSKNTNDVPSNYLHGLNELIEENCKSDFNVVEIGSYEGASTELFCLSFAHVTSIDPYDAGEQFGQETKEELKAAFNVFQNRMLPYCNYRQLQLNSEEGLKLIPNDSVDFIYIDGDHRKESVIRDIRLSLPKIKNGGFIAGHDYYGHIAEAVEEILGKPNKVYQDSSWVVKKL